MKNLKNIIIQSLVLSLLVGTTALAAWEEFPIRKFLNRGEGGRLLLITIEANYRLANVGFTFSIHADPRSFEALQDHVSQWGFPFRRDDFHRIVHVDVPRSEAERAYNLLDVLNAFEAIQPQQVLGQMRAGLDLLLASFINQQQQLAEREARRFGAQPFHQGEIHRMGAYPLPVNLRADGGALRILPAPEDAKARGIQLTPAQYQSVSREDLSSNELELSCAICQNSYSELAENKAEVVRVHCLGHAEQPGHLFCKSCIHQSYQLKRTCPSCRGQIVEAENIVAEGDAPFLFNQSAAAWLNLDVAKMTTMAAKSFCAARGKKLVGFKTRESVHTLPMQAYMGNNREPVQVAELGVGDAPHIEFSEIWCTK